MAFFACLAPSLSPTDSRLRQPVLEHRLTGFTTSPPHPLSMNGEGDKCFSCRNTRTEKSTITQKPSPQLTTHQAKHKKPHPNSQHTRPKTKSPTQTHNTPGQTRHTKPHHLMKCARMGAFRGRGGTGPPTKKQRGVGGLVPPQKKKRGAYSPQANSALCGAYPPEADSPRPRRNGIRSR